MKCMKKGCTTDFNNPGVIHCIYPVFFRGKWHEIHFCRVHFYDADQLNARELLDWLNIEEGEE